VEEKQSFPPRQGTQNAGAFLGPGGTFPADMRTLSDDLPTPASERDAERFGSQERRPPRALFEILRDWIRGHP
jgi:hypothetical protein